MAQGESSQQGVTPNSQLPAEVREFFTADAHGQIANKKGFAYMKGLADILTEMTNVRDREDVGYKLYGQQGISANIFWALYRLEIETKVAQKEILIHKIASLHEKIKEANEEIAKAEESNEAGLIFKISKVVVDHLKGLAEIFVGFSFENPWIVGLGFSSLGLTTWEDFKSLTEKEDTTELKKKLKLLEEELKKDEEELKKLELRKAPPHLDHLQ